MKILITGAGGFVGSRLAEFYSKKYDVWTPSHHEFDFTDPEAARAGIQAYHPDVVLHCAAISDVGTCEKNPELSRKVNLEGTVNLAACCAEAGIKLVYCSSDQVYVRSRYEEESEEEYLTPWKEEDGKDPKPLYGQHKLAAEKMCQKICPSSVGLRLTWMYGTLNDKETAAGRRNMEVILREAILDKKPVTLSETDFRAVTDINEVVANMEKVWQLPGGVYNYGSSSVGSIYEAVCGAFAEAGLSEICAEYVVKAEGGNLRNLTMNISKIEEAGIHFDDTKTALARCIRKIVG